MKSHFLYEVFAAEENMNKAFSCFFDSLSIDPYIEGNYRRRAYSRYLLSERSVIRQPHLPFQQGEENSLLSGMVREYAPLDKVVDLLPSFYKLLQEFAFRVQIDPTREIIDVHQIRIKVGSDHQGLPAPEGIHQDGMRFVGIFCVKRENVHGAYTELYDSPESDPLIHCKLEENQCLIVNDHDFYHYASSITPKDPTRKALRDVFVLTA